MVREFEYELSISGSTVDGPVAFQIYGKTGIDDSMLQAGDLLNLGNSGYSVIVPLSNMHKIYLPLNADKDAN